MKRLIGLLMPAIFAVSACKKDDAPPTNNWPVPKVKTIRSGGATDHIDYDSEGRCVKVEGARHRYDYTYEPGKVIVKITDLESNGVQTSTYELNAQGYVTGENNTAYSYTKEGYLKTVSTLGSPNRFTNYLYNSVTGLLDSITVEGNGWERTDIYTYYTDKQQTIGNDNLGREFMGKSLPHPVKSIVTWRAAPPPVYREKARTTSYTYLYDEQGRIVRQEVSTDNATGGSISVYTYY